MRFAISPHMEQVHFPPISEVKEWVAGRTFSAERPLVDLCQAVPDYPPAAELIAHLKTALNDPQVARYSPDEGLIEVRRALCSWYGRMYRAQLHPGQICLTVGASQAFWLAMTTLCRAGDEVVVQTPYYFDHAMGLDLLGVRPVLAPFDPATGGLPDPAILAGLIRPRTRALLLVSPSNPTGAVIPPALLRRLLDLARERGIALVLDETYHAFVEPPPHELFCDPTWADHFIHLASFGKTFALTGFRAGALVASEAFLRHALKAQDSMVVCQPRLTQLAIQYGVEQLDGWVAANRQLLQKRHDLFRSEFLRSGNPFELVASGGFFAWVRHPLNGRSGRQVARLLADRADLICLPGEVFGPGLEGYLRLAFGNIRAEEIPAAVARFRAFLVA
jgi:aspartate/methionine/tyrosine aminotransferase